MKNLTDEIKKLLDLPKEDVDIEKAALLLLKINRNKIMYHNLVRRNAVDKALYELRKHYDSRLRTHIIKEAPEMETKVAEVIENTPEIKSDEEIDEKVTKGKRDDHEELPDEVKALYLENFNILRRMRKLHEQLKLMVDNSPCDRFPYLSELLAFDTKLRKNWELYDSYKPGDSLDAFTQTKEEIKDPEKGSEGDGELEPADPKKVSTARKYLSTNKKKAQTLEGDPKKELISKMQERLDYLIRTGSGISDKQLAEYKELGLNV